MDLILAVLAVVAAIYVVGVVLGGVAFVVMWVDRNVRGDG